MAERTGLEPATPGVTGRYSNQLNYRSALVRPKSKLKAWRCSTLTWGNPTLPSTLFRFTSEFGMEVRWVQNAMVAKQILKIRKAVYVLYTFNVLV